MVIETITDEEQYRKIHQEIFGQSDVPMPQVVRVCRTDSGDAVGIVAGLWLSDDYFYIQYGGILPKYRKHGYLRYFGSMLDPNIIYSLSITNTNITAIKTALSVGFIPVGFHLKNNTYFVQFERGKLDG